jgi:hypothetical protein
MIGASAATVAVVSQPSDVGGRTYFVDENGLLRSSDFGQSCCLGDCSVSCFALSSATRIDGVQGRE